jgi:hypothetical protein
MGSRSFKIVRMTDKELLDGVAEFSKLAHLSPNAIALYTSENKRHPYSVSLSDYTTNTQLTEAFAAKSRVFTHVDVAFPQIHSSLNFKREETFDQVTVNFPDETPEKHISFISAVAKTFPTIDSAERVQEILGKEVAEFYQRREEALVRLENLSLKLVEQNEEYRRNLDKESDQLRTKNLTELDEERKKVEASKSEMEAALKERELQLDERTKQLDDRSSRHARRQLRQDLKKSLEERGHAFKLSPTTNLKRIPLHLLFILLILIPTMAFLRSITIDVTQTQLESAWSWFYVLKPVLSGVAVAAAIIFYIRWNNEWFHQHSSEEFRLKRLDLDIDRASWIVEMALEWKDEKGSEFPPGLADRLSRNLFVDDFGDFKQPKHPTEDLASALLGASTSLSMKIPGVGDAVLDRKGIKNFQKAAVESTSEK